MLMSLILSCCAKCAYDIFYDCLSFIICASDQNVAPHTLPPRPACHCNRVLCKPQGQMQAYALRWANRNRIVEYRSCAKRVVGRQALYDRRVLSGTILQSRPERQPLHHRKQRGKRLRRQSRNGMGVPPQRKGLHRLHRLRQFYGVRMFQRHEVLGNVRIEIWHCRSFAGPLECRCLQGQMGAAVPAPQLGVYQNVQRGCRAQVARVSHWQRARAPPWAEVRRAYSGV